MAPDGRLLATLILLGGANHVVLAGGRVAVSLDALALGASPFVVGVLMALFALLPMFCSVAVGRLSDRIGARPPMLVGTAGLAVGALLPAFWPGLPALFVGAALLGVAFMAFQLAVQRAVGDIGTASDRPRSFAVLALGYSVSGFVGPLVAGYSIDHLGFAGAFAVLAAFTAVPLALLASRRVPLPGRPGVAGAAHPGGIRALLRHRVLRNVMAVNVLISAGWDLHTVFIPIYGEHVGLSASEIGIVLAAFAAATFLIRLLTPALVRGRSERQMLVWSLLGGGAAYLLFPWAQTTLALAALSFLLGLALGSGQPIVLSLLHAHAPQGRIGETVGVRMSLINTSAVAVPLLFGAVGSTFGLTPVFWSMGACLASGGWLARRRANR